MLQLERKHHGNISTYTAKKIIENTGSEVLGVIAYDSIKKFGKKNSHQIDTTSKSVSKISKIVLNPEIDDNAFKFPKETTETKN